MKRISLSSVFFRGRYIRYLSDQESLKSVVQGRNRVLEILRHVREFIENFDINSAGREKIDKWIRVLDSRYGPGEHLQPKDAKNLSRDIRLIAERIQVTLGNVSAFVTTVTGPINREVLVRGGAAVFGEGIWAKIPSQARRDFRESIRCLLFEIPTAGAMSALRGMEALLRWWYRSQTGQMPSATASWAKLLDALKAQGTRTTLLEHLDYLRDQYRNKAAHPGKFFNQQESENLLSGLVGTVSQLLSD